MQKMENGPSSVINWPGQSTLDWPGWVPKAAAHYIRHVEQGQSLRQLAQQSGCHPSTVLRQVRGWKAAVTIRWWIPLCGFWEFPLLKRRR
ncbi:helix-turn-helix domain-containing protein [Phaeobacter sp. J2-8]|uniref:helix-turn-helix domain-containing protein n=1 Tax=Phaeobacter sp. J2-8 TaxID=2931394 RepID=UPI0032AFC313